MVALTGHEPQTYADAGTQVPARLTLTDPSASNDHRRWAGNVATTQEPVDETVASRAFCEPLP